MDEAFEYTSKDIVDIYWCYIAVLYNMYVQVYEFIAGGKARR